MTKKATTKTPTKITFEVRLIGPGIAPDMVPPRAMFDAITAIQDIASGRDPFETAVVPEDKQINLVDVKKSSAVYCCRARDPNFAISNLRRVGKLLASDDAKTDWNELTPSIAAIKSICDVARSIGCRLEVRTPNGKSGALLQVNEDDYERIKKRVFVTGETMIAGRVERIGGATELRCLLRVPGRHRLLYCNVDNETLARKLGEHLYEDVVATGTATWLHQSWRVHHFIIRGFSQPKLRNADEAIAGLRAAGLDAWDEVENPENLVEEMRW